MVQAPWPREPGERHLQERPASFPRNDFQCTIEQVRDPADPDSIHWRAVFLLNGRRMTAEHRQPHDQSLMDAGRALRDAIARAIADEALVEMAALVKRQALFTPGV